MSNSQIRDIFVFIQIFTIFATGLLNKFTYAILTVVCLLFMYLANPKAMNSTFKINKLTIWLYAWMVHRLICLSLSIFGYGNMVFTTFVEQARIVLCCFILIYYWDYIKKIPRWWVTGLLLVFTLVNLYSLYSLTLYPQLSRDLAAATVTGATKYVSGILVGGYGYIYAQIFILPALLYMFFKNAKKSLIVLIAIISGFSVVLKASYMICVLLLMLSLFMTFLSFKFPKRGLMIAVVIAVLGLFFWSHISSFVVDHLSQLYYHVNNQIYKTKLLEIIQLLTTGDAGATSDIANRMWRYLVSWDTFKNNFLVGIGAFYNNTQLLGLHSTILDDLGRYGMLAVFAFMAVIKYFKYVKSHLPQRFEPYCDNSILLIILLSIVNNTHFAAILVGALCVAPIFIGSISSECTENDGIKGARSVSNHPSNNSKIRISNLKM